MMLSDFCLCEAVHFDGILAMYVLYRTNNLRGQLKQNIN